MNSFPQQPSADQTTRSQRWARRLAGPAAGAVSGLLLAVSFPSVGFFPVAWVALTPFLLFLLGTPSWSATLAAHAAFCLGYFGPVLYWIPGVLDAYGKSGWALAAGIFAVMLVVLTLYPLPFTFVTRWLAQRHPRAAIIAAPAAWLAGELLRNDFIADGFPWAALGYSQFPYGCLIQITDVVGVYGLSWLVAFASTAAAAWLLFRWRGPLVFLAAVLLAVNGYGLYRLYVWQPASGAPLEVALVQPNITVYGDREYYAEVFFKRLPQFYEWAAGSGSGLVIFPEAPNPFYFEQDFYFQTAYRRMVDDFRTPLIFNGTAHNDGASVNSAFLVDPRKEGTSRYDKIHLVPFGEYLPYGEWLGFSRPLVQHIGGFTAGRRRELLTLGDVPLGLLICYEAIFPELSRDAVRQGAQLLVNLTNDLWFGDTAAPEQHLQMSAFRAIEQRRYLLRAANSGYSGVVDPWGRVLERSRLFESRVLKVQVRPVSTRTPYSTIGEGASFLIIITSVIAALPWRRRKAAMETR